MMASNRRMSEWQGALLNAQLTRLDEQTKTREGNASYLGQGLSDIPGVGPIVRHPKVMDRFYEDSLPGYERTAAYGYDAVLIAESWASVDIISPQQHADFAFPYQKAAIDAAHANGLKAILYSTGYLLPILPKMCELGMDALTLEEGRKGEPMDIGKVREIMGPKQCIFGNFDAEDVLLRGNREDIEGDVIRQIDSAGRDGAFIMGTGSPVCDDTGPEQIDSFIESTRKHGEY